ncbi:MAG TPA: NADH-ubiquinone oxidoreductase-F iron-sulfur binding region domain-containing protein, partial [Acidimicrobiales bacterium]|nr:NADH-ubiquinone oxidoreductase-F iron-sulfur binding region domain-containing protein [Acidimicrobiales bacterium]
MSMTVQARTGDATAAAGRVPRLLAAPPLRTLPEHQARYGPYRPAGACLIDEVDEAGLRGRGGSGFPTAIKMRAVAAARGRRRPVVVANGSEGEPASSKDKVLLTTAPHLVFDGMAAAAAAVGASRAVLCVDRREREVGHIARSALHERRGRDGLDLDVVDVPSRYVAGEETALVSWLDGGLAKPTYKLTRPAERGVGGAPTLVDNVETLAQVAWIARFGAPAWRAVGDGDERGTMLVTVRGGVRRPGVFEIPLGTPMASMLGHAGAGQPTGVLVGGYFGTWLTPSEASVALLSSRGLRPYGASLGCGLIAPMPSGHCPLEEVSRVVRWLAANSAGQCGSCLNGLPALAAAFDRVIDGDGAAIRSVDRWSPMIEGRGACKLPDGAVRFLGSSRR